jgi:outer membrane immunogenic protein
MPCLFRIVPQFRLGLPSRCVLAATDTACCKPYKGVTEITCRPAPGNTMTKEFVMKKYLLSGVAALGLIAAGAASAADLPSRKGPVVAPVYVPAFTWTGFYVGANAGYGFGNMDSVGVNAFGDLDGFVGGGQIGYNYQIGQIVLGVEADFQGADLKAGSSFAGLGIVGEGKTEWFGTVRGRVGFAYDRFLPYITGGLAYGNVKTTLAPGVTINGLNSDDNTHTGWTLGAGVEYAFTNNIVAGVEYLYVDLGDKKVFNGADKVGTDFSLVRARLSYKF